MTSRMALSATDLIVPSGFCEVEDEILGAGRVDAPLHVEIDVDDVLVAGQHQAFLEHVAAAALRRLAGSRSGWCAARARPASRTWPIG